VIHVTGILPFFLGRRAYSTGLSGKEVLVLAAHKEKTTTSEAAGGTRGIDPLRCAVTLRPPLRGTINFPLLGSFHSHWSVHLVKIRLTQRVSSHSITAIMWRQI
jgi:hypothetical protein